MTRTIALLLTVLTGFSGLAYQITWQKYLATLLGSHSEATAAVLGIFLGGLSVGYWLFGRVTQRIVDRARAAGRPAPLLLTYGLLEASIGVYALLFPVLFEGVRTLSYALPYGPGAFGFAVDVVLVALLIGPATVLMGGTIPILTQALSRSLEEATRFHALVYAFNTAGAFAGALAAGFVLVPQLGLVRVMLAMGAINLVAGAVFVVIDLVTRTGAPAETARPETSASPEGLRVYAAIALLVGFAMMVIQTGVIRVAALSFGPSQFTFSMVVGIFVLCIALGSFAVSVLPAVRTRHVVANQWALAALVLLLDFALPRTPFWAYLLRGQFENTQLAFYLFHGQVFLLLGVMCGPAILCSGASLPLLFHQLRREVGELGSVAGSLYSWNTIGSLLGALLGGYALLFWLELHQVYGLAVGALLLAALLLTVRVYDLRRPVALALAPLVGIPSLLGAWDPKLLSLGLFRERVVWESAYQGKAEFLRSYFPYQEPLVHYEDDPTMTVSVWVNQIGDRSSLTLKTNGKPDGNTFGDYTTMALLGVVPALFSDEPRNAFVVGWGTGVTAGELAEIDSMERVIVSEISKGVIDAAPLFDSANLGASRNRKIEIVRSDAYRALMRSKGSFDVIVSEPSNPWVAGVENLFSREFLTAARGRLSPGGVYAQWIHQYEVDEPTLGIVLRTYAGVFDHVSVWYTQGSDLLLLGFANPGSAKDHFRLEQRAQRADFRSALRRAGVASLPALLAHEVLPLGVIHAAQLSGPVQSLYHPRLGYLAGRAFFLRRNTGVPFTGSGLASEVGARNSLLRRYASRFGGRLPDSVREEVLLETCKYNSELCSTLLAQWQHEGPDSPALSGLREKLIGIDAEAIDSLARFYEPETRRDSEPVAPHRAAELGAKYVDHYHHAAPFHPDALLSLWARCRLSPPSAKQCAESVAAQRSSAPLDSLSIEEWFDRCSSTPRIGQVCQRGLDAARELLAGPLR